MPSLLQKFAAERAREGERLRFLVRAQLQAELRELLPDQPVVIFGSLTKLGKFSTTSDVDVALEAEPASMSELSRIVQTVAEELPHWCSDFGAKVRTEQGWS